MLSDANPVPETTPEPTPEAGPATQVLGRSRQHWLVLAAALFGILGLVVLAVALEPDGRGVGTHEQLGLKPCMTMEMWGVPCPGCGVTTSVTMAVQGDLLGSFVNQPFGFVVFLLGLGFIGWALIGQLRGRDLWADLGVMNTVPWLKVLGTLAGAAWLYKCWRLMG